MTCSQGHFKSPCSPRCCVCVGAFCRLFCSRTQFLTHSVFALFPRHCCQGDTYHSPSIMAKRSSPLLLIFWHGSPASVNSPMILASSALACWSWKVKRSQSSNGLVENYPQVGLCLPPQYPVTQIHSCNSGNMSSLALPISFSIGAGVWLWMSLSLRWHCKKRIFARPMLVTVDTGA